MSANPQMERADHTSKRDAVIPEPFRADDGVAVACGF